MKKLLLISVFVIAAFVLGCQPDAAPGNNSPANNNSSKVSDLKVLNWGPDQTKVGTIPNKQASGKMGIWIQVESTNGLGDMQVLFAGHPVETAIQPKLITAGVTAEDIAAAGDKSIEIKMPSGQTIPVGTFKVTP